LIINKYSGYNAYNFGVFKITDSKLIESFNLEYPDCQPGMPIYDEEYIGQIALPHCFVLYEESKRF
jgi:hypothetical protein